MGVWVSLICVHCTVSGAQDSLNCPAKDTSPNTIPPNVATSLIVEVGITFDQPGDWSSFMGSQSSRRTKASAAVTDSWTDAKTVAAVVTVSVAVTDSLIEQMAVCLDKVVSAADAASLTEAGNVVFDDGVSVAVLVSDTAQGYTKMAEGTSVPVAVSATRGVNTAPACVASEAVAVSEVDTA